MERLAFDAQPNDTTFDRKSDEESSYHVGRGWYALIVFQIMGLAAGIDIAIVTLLVHPIEIAFRINDVGFSAITTIPLVIGTTVIQYPAGILTDVFSRRNIIAASAVVWTLGAAVAVCANSESLFFIARLLGGIGTSLYVPSVFSVLTDAFPQTRRAFIQSVSLAVGSIGVGVGLTLCGALVVATQRNGVIHVGSMSLVPWQQCFVACMAMGIITIVLSLTVHEPLRRDRLTSAKVDLKLSLRIFGQYLGRHWLLWTLVFIGYCVGWTSYSGVAAWGPTFGMRQYHITGVSSVALLGTFVAGGSLLGSVIGGLLAQRSVNVGGPRMLPRMLVIVTVLSCVFSVVFPYMPSWLLAVTGIAGVAATGLIPVVLVSVAIQETAPNEVRGQLMGLSNILLFIPSVLGATIVAFFASGVLAKVGGLGPALAAVGGITSVIAVLTFVFSVRPYEQALLERRTQISLSHQEGIPERVLQQS